MIDPDDIDAIALHFAMARLEHLANQLSDPEKTWDVFIERTVATWASRGRHWDDLDHCRLLAARATIADLVMYS